MVKTEEGEDDLTHLEGSVKLRRVGSEQRGSISPPVNAPSLPPIATPLYEHRRPLPPVSNERSPTETISTSATLLDPISGVVPSFPNQGYGYNTVPMPIEGQYNVSPDISNQWLSEFSPQWSDQSMVYNNSNVISPVSAGMPSATYASGSNGEFSFFPSFAQSSSNGNRNGYQPQFMQNDGNGNGNGQDQSLMELGMDKDMIMALGIEGGMSMSMSNSMEGGHVASGSGGGGNGNGNGNGNGGWGEGAGTELDFDQWVDGLGGGFP